MAKLDRDTIAQLTKLSRIACSPKEQDALLKDLQRILAYVEQLNEISTDDVPPCNHVLEDMANVMREDHVKVDDTLPRAVFLGNAAEQIGGMVKVPPVIKNH